MAVWGDSFASNYRGGCGRWRCPRGASPSADVRLSAWRRRFSGGGGGIGRSCVMEGLTVQHSCPSVSHMELGVNLQGVGGFCRNSQNSCGVGNSRHRVLFIADGRAHEKVFSCSRYGYAVVMSDER